MNRASLATTLKFLILSIGMAGLTLSLRTATLQNGLPPFPGPPPRAAQSPAARTPKDAEVQKSLGAPMKRTSLIVVPPDTNAPVQVTVTCNPTPNVSYQWVIGTNLNLFTTNFIGTTWTNITATNWFAMTLSVPEGTRFSCRMRMAGATNKFSEFAIDGGFNFNAFVLTWTNPPSPQPLGPLGLVKQPVWLGLLNDFRYTNWAWVQATSPTTNMVDLKAKSVFYRLLSPQGIPLTIAMAPAWIYDPTNNINGRL